MNPLRHLLRPGVIVSVLVHGVLVAAALLTVRAAAATRPALVLSFVSDEASGSVDADEAPPPPETPRDVEPVRAEPAPAEAPPAEDLPSDLEPASDLEPTAVLEFDRVPVGLPSRRPAAPAAVVSPTVATAAPAAPPQVAQRSGGGPTRGALPVGNRKPVYPAEALARGWEGVVRIVVGVREDGTVGDVRLAESSGYAALDGAALAAAWSWRYEPRLVEGAPAPDLLLVPIVFRLQ